MKTHRHSSFGHRHRGWTLVELAAALTLAALLTAGLTGALAGLIRQRAECERESTPAARRTRFIRVLSRDLAQARSARGEPRHLVLDGFGGRDASGPLRLPAEIEYCVDDRSQPARLVRRERLRESSDDRIAAELLWVGVGDWSIVPLDAERGSQGHWSGPIPRALRVTVSDVEGTSLVEETIYAY